MLLFFSFTVIISLNGQILNSEFDSWTSIDTSGQPYLDLTEWDTNNVGKGNGLATTPNKRIQEGNDNGVSIASRFEGTDGLYSGTISQTITIDKLTFIEYLSKCDSIYEKGSCVVNIYSDNEYLIFTDSIKVEEINYSTKRISLANLQNTQTQNIKIEFKAFGQIGQWEPFQAYSEFNLLKVEANYISSTNRFESETVNTFPNPFNSSIDISTNDNQKVKYQLINSRGRVLDIGFGNKINTTKLNTGVYTIIIQTGEQLLTRKMIKH